MEIPIELIYITVTLLIMAGGYFFCQKSKSNSVASIEGTYAGHGTNDAEKPAIIKKIKVTVLNKKEIEISSPDFPSFTSKIYANCRDIIISNKSSHFNIMFNTDLKSITFNDNKSELTFVGFIQNPAL